MKCLQCGSSDIVRNVRAFDRDHGGLGQDLPLQVHNNPDAMFFKGPELFPLKANVCAQCGFVMLSVSRDEAKRIKAVKGKVRHALDR